MSEGAAGDEARQRMQNKSFRTWVNLHLGKAGLEINDLKTEFADGIKLLKLVEVISEESLGKYNKKPISKFQKVENLNIPLKYINGFIKSQGISNQYSAENILEENELLILGMVWSLILRFAVQQISEGDRTAKEGLLLWAQKKIEEGSKGKVTVTNFHTSWQDGMAFCSLIQAFRPDLIDYNSVRKSDDRGTQIKNLNLAFDTAANSLSIPKMLDATDMTQTKPDEKSVMTYVSFFWKEFASTKKKTLAAERISYVVSREIHYKELQAQYVEQATGLAEWITERQAKFSAGPGGSDASELQRTLDEYVEYGRTVRPAKIQDLMEVEALHASIETRLQALGSRTYAPPESCALPKLKRWWEELTLAEQSYEEAIKRSLTNIKRIGGLIKIFNSKAGKLDVWLATKAAWVQAAHDVCLTQLGKPPAEPAAEPAADPTAALSFSSPSLDAQVSQEDFQRLDDPTLTPMKPGDLLSKPSSTAEAVAAAAATAAEAAAVANGAEGDDEKPAKRTSIFDSIFAAIQDNFVPKPAIEEEVSKEDLAELTPSRASSSVLKSRRSQEAFTEELREQKVRHTESHLDSISAVLAKLNLLKAYEEEQSSRELSLANLVKMVGELKAMGCPANILDVVDTRGSDLREAISSLAAAAGRYRSDLEEVLSAQQALDEKRLSFAKRAEALNRWFEEATDAMSEVMAVETMAEADTIEGELAAFRQEYTSQKEEYDALTSLEAEIAPKGANPYSRFKASDLGAALEGALAAAEERGKRLTVERAKVAETDGKKRAFAASAEVALSFLKKEKELLASKALSTPVLADDADSIAAGKATLEFLQAYSAQSSERLAQLATAQELADELMALAELDNPYTRESMASLKSVANQLEKLVRDQQSLVEGQLARATVQITPEQHRELKDAFTHFDKSGDGRLNKIEFIAAIKSMDLELEVDDEFAKHADGRAKSPDDPGTTEPTISFEPFLTLILQQYKDKDTSDGLIGAFRTLSNGKDALPLAELDKFLKPADAAFLKEALAPTDDGYEYAAFATAVYGGSS